MPDFYMHHKIAKAIAKIISQPIDENMLLVGAQGPDPLYYPVLNKRSTTFHTYADYLHEKNTSKALTHMTTYTKNNFNKDTYSFLIGYICHYGLDITVHPYVYHNVGIYNKNDSSTKEMQGLHLKFERSIDAALIEKDTNRKAHKFPFTKKCFPVKNVTTNVSDMMDDLLKTTFEEKDGNAMWQQAVKAQYLTIKHLVTDRFGYKKVFLRVMDVFLKQEDMFLKDLSMFHHLETYDYLNLNHTPWLHPITGEKFTLSIPDLYDQALARTSQMIEKVNQYIFDNETIDLNKVFGNLSYNSGIDCDHDQTMKHLNIYRKKTT
jgi:hypothetical protein